MSTILNALKRANIEKDRLPLSQRGPLLEEEPLTPEQVEDHDIHLLYERQRRTAIRIIIGMAVGAILFVSILVFLVVWLWGEANQTQRQTPAKPPISTTPPVQPTRPPAPAGHNPAAAPGVGDLVPLSSAGTPEGGAEVRTLRSRLAPPMTPVAVTTPEALPAHATPTPPSRTPSAATPAAPKPTLVERMAVPTPEAGRIKPAPTLPPSEMTEDEQKVFASFKVGGILWSKEAPIAIIDEQYCKVGDSVKGFKVLDIRKGEVEIQAPSGARCVMPY
ncbi:MAG: hypothetical protein NTX50_14150 [Candidatus Sumerlaeota bacterium]|nr:hypothetical protein [Candidatus Sumerlaeota bacterium]